ncbi:MAG: phosphoribosylglycinamide formyltransferase [Verrucomicrobia bacterium]|nr:phosphoribosylglycinamide formyltransferase [Verrucomicrobiota bacterium]
MRKLKVGVLGSGQGSNFLALAEAIREGKVPAEIVIVGSDLAEAKILTHAKKLGQPTLVCRAGKFKTKLEPEIEEELAQSLEESGSELLVLAGYMRVLKEPLLRKFRGRIINIHPSLLPAFPGLKAWEQALNAGVKETGCTVHWVDQVVDGGAILRQEKVMIESGDTAESLHERIQEAEHRCLPEVVKDLAEGKIAWEMDPRR